MPLTSTLPTESAAIPAAGGASKARLDAVDFLRGVVMVIMALDHVRGMVSNVAFDPTDVSKTNLLLFFTRWITHFCAPTFVFLAGTGAFLGAARGKSKSELSRFLWTRGLWLIILEFTVIRFGWFLTFEYDSLVGMVIWALGCSMIALAGLIYLPVRAITVFGLAMVFLHNLLDGLEAKELGVLAPVWGILHGGYSFDLVPGLKFIPGYPLIPWIGVMALGYAFGAVLMRPPQARQVWMLSAGLIAIGLFGMFRGFNLYGDPRPWPSQSSWSGSLMAILNCSKYPPSLSFLLMTLGPALLVLAATDWALEEGKAKAKCWFRSSIAPVVTFGRVPLFYYVLHLPLIHLLFGIISYPVHGAFYFIRPEPKYGFNLWVVYAVWVLVVALLYPVCRWFAGVKSRNRSGWLSYL